MTEDHPHLRVVPPVPDPALPPLAEQERMVEAMLFASAAPLTLAEMAARMPAGSDAAEALAALLDQDPYATGGYLTGRVIRAWDPPLGSLADR